MARVRRCFGAIGEWRFVREDTGQSALVIILLVVIAAGVAISQLSLQNSKQELDVEKSTRAQFDKIKAAIELYAIQDTATSSQNFLLPCPAGTGSSGAARSHNGTACNSSAGDNRGIVPWATLGLAESEVIDPHGNYITYVVHATSVGACNGTSAATDPVPNANGGSNVGYALISHGTNGFGAYKASTGSQVNATLASTRERDNCPTVSGTCTPSDTNGYRSGPVDDTQGSNFFDDITLGVSFSARFADECPELNNNSDNNEFRFVDEAFGDSSGNGSSTEITVTVTGGSSSSAEGSGVLTVAENVELATTNTRFTSSITPLYISIQWRPTAVATTTGFSIVTRADRTTRSAGTSNYTDGITIDFFSDGDPATDQTIRIQENGGSASTSGVDVYDLNTGTTYLLEVFDDGTQIWARITESGNTSNQATVISARANDLATPNQVIFLHDDTSGATSTLDNLLVAKGMVALELDNSGALTAASDPTATFTSDTNFSEEGWLYLRDASSGTVNMMRINDGLTDSQFQVNAGTGQVTYNDAGGSALTASRSFSTGSWAHIAFTCESGTNRALLVNGSTIGSADTNSCDAVDGTWSSQQVENSSGGRIILSEIRQWSNRQNAASTTSNYNRRVANSEADLRLQLQLNDGQGGGGASFTTDTVANDNESPAQNFNITGGRLVGFLTPFRSTASDVCPGNEDATDPFKCVWDGGAGGTATTDTLNLPLDITEVLVKVWGAGGGSGGGSNNGSGGGGGYATGRLTQISSTSIAGGSILITAGGAGQQDTGGGSNGGGGGGGGSAVRYSDGTTTTVVAVSGGGGGGGGNSAGALNGLAGGGAAGETATNACHGGSASGSTPGTGSNCGGGSGASGTFDATNGGNGGNAGGGGAGGGTGGTGFGNGGNGTQSGGTTPGAGGGGYAGGGGGDASSGTRGAGGGGSGFLSADSGFASTSQSAGSGATAGNSGDTDRGTAGNGGASSNGNPGRVVVCWSSSCLP